MKKGGKTKVRDAEGSSVMVALRVPTAMLKKIDDLATGGLVPATRTAAMLKALELGLASIGRAKR